MPPLTNLNKQMKKLLFAYVAIILSALSVYAQSIEINDVKKTKFSGVYPILSGESGEVNGYFTYYMLEKGKKGMRTFQFALMNNEMTELKKTDLELHKNSSINATVFNGKFLMISWDDFKNKKTVVKLIDTKGIVVKSKEFPFEKVRYAGTSVYPMKGGEGFYITRPEKRKKGILGYSIQKINNDLAVIWKQDVLPTRGSKSVKDLVNVEDRLVVWEENSPKGNKKRPAIVCFEADKGAKVFEREGYDGVSTILNNQLRIDKDNNIYAGGAYIDGDKYSSVNNDGIYLLKLDPNGKEILYTKVSNKEKIQQALKANSKGFALGSKDKVFIEDLILVDDHIIVVSEMFKKNMNMTPKPVQQTRDLITGKYVGWAEQNNDSKVTFEIKDFILFKFTQKGDLEEIKVIKKDKTNKITVWGSLTNLRGMDLAKLLAQRGWFDYGFTTLDQSGNSLMVCSNNATSKPDIAVYNVNEQYAKIKVNLKQQAKVDLEKAQVSYFKPIKNNKGKIAVAYYQKKLQKITVNLESIYEF